MNDSESAANDGNRTERRVLSVMRDILTRVARETATTPGTRHVLTDETIEQIRHCLSLISAREMELAKDPDEISANRPRYPGQTSRRDKVRLSIQSITGQSGSSDKDDSSEQ